MTRELSLTQVALALSDPLRVRILDLLAAGRNELCPSPNNPNFPAALCALDLQRQLGDIAPSKLSYHIKELRDADLIQERRCGKWVYYRLNQPAVEQFLKDVAQRYLEQHSGALASPALSVGERGPQMPRHPVSDP